MKRKDYEKLLDKIEEANLVYGGWILEIGDYNPADGNYSYEQLEQERDKAKKILDEYKAQLEDILTIDMEIFARDFLGYIAKKNNQEYELEKYPIKGKILWLAKPKETNIIKVGDIINNDLVYVLGEGKERSLAKRLVSVGGIYYPMIYVGGKILSSVYMGETFAEHKKYFELKGYMSKWENQLVESYKPKKNNKR